MVHINLLPVRQIKQRAAAGKQLLMMSVAVLIMLAMLAVAGLAQKSQITGLQGEISKLEKEKKRLAKVQKLINDFEKEKAIIERQIKIVADLQKKKSLTVHVLDEVARATPLDRMWLSSFSQSGGSLSLAGTALDNRTIAKYMDVLKDPEKTPYITDVTLVKTSMKTFAGRSLKSFSLSCSVAVPVEKVKEESKK